MDRNNSNALIDALAEVVQQKMSGGPQFKHTTPTGTPSTPYYHGPGGLFNMRGIERQLISTRVMPRTLADTLPARGTNVTDPIFAFITGFQDGSGSEKDGVCDDPPVGGPLKVCRTVAQFGRFERMTRELELNAIGRQQDRGEFMDLTLVNGPLLDGQGGITTPNVGGQANLNNEIYMRMTELGVSFQNLIAPKLYTGNPANNAAGGGYKEFPGLDILIGTGKVDAVTGQTCPSLDSLMMDYNYASVDDQTASGDLVNIVTYAMRYLDDLAGRTNLAPVEFALAMRPALFYELSAMWPCSYLTYRCIERISGTVNFDAGDAIAMRDAMRNGSYLIVDGKQVRVVLDDSIVEESNTTSSSVPNGSFASDIYILPLTVRGGSFATLYWEYFDYNTPMGMLSSGPGSLAQNHFWSDGGRWLWHFKPPVNWCIQWIAKTEPRLILRTPHLAGRIQNIRYKPLLQNRQAFPTDPYFVDGGVTSGPAGPSYYSEWNS